MALLSEQYFFNIDLVKNSLLNFKIHPLSTVNRNALGLTLTTNDSGVTVFDTDLNELFNWTGSSWISYAPVDSPSFTGNPLSVTPILGDNSTSIATTAFVQETVNDVAIYFGSDFDGVGNITTPIGITPNLFIDNQNSTPQAASYYINGTTQIGGTDTVTTSWSGLNISKNIVLNADNIIGSLLTLSGTGSISGGHTNSFPLAIYSPSTLSSVFLGAVYTNAQFVTSAVRVLANLFAPTPPYYLDFQNHSGTVLGRIFDSNSHFTWGSTTDLGSTFGVDGSFSTTGVVTLTGLSTGTPISGGILALNSSNQLVLTTAGGGGSNIYNTDGTLSTNRIVTLGGHLLAFTDTSNTSNETALEVLAGVITGGVVNTTSSNSGGAFEITNSTSEFIYNNSSNQTGLFITNSAITIKDQINSIGLQEFADYSANYTSSNYITKRYADATYVSGGGATNIYNSDGSLTGNRIVDIGLDSLTLSSSGSSTQGVSLLLDNSASESSMILKATGVGSQHGSFGAGGGGGFECTAEMAVLGTAGYKKIQIDGTQNGSGIGIQDDVDSLGFVYNSDYSASGLTNPLWLPNLLAVQGLISASSSTGINGLNGTSNIGLGGTLTSTVNIDLGTSGSFDFNIGHNFGIFSSEVDFYIDNASIRGQVYDSSGNYSEIGSYGTQARIIVQGTTGNLLGIIPTIGSFSGFSQGITITDQIYNKGAFYAADYSANYTSRSIPDVAYVLAHSGSGTVTAVSVASANGFTGTSSGGATPALTLTTSITGVLKGNGTAISAATAGTDYLTPTGSAASLTSFPTFNQNTTGSAAKWTTARNLAGNSVDGSTNVAFTNKFIVQGTTDAGLSSAQFLGALATGIVKNTTTTGILSIAAAGTDYQAAITGTGFVKSTSGTISYDTNTYLTANQSITLSGDITGSGTTAITTTLATVNSNVGSFGSSTSIPSITVNGKGLITAISGNVVIAPAGTLSGTTLNSTVVTSSLTSVGTLSAGSIPYSLLTGTPSLAGYQLISNLETTLTNSTTLYPSGSAVQTYVTGLGYASSLTPTSNKTSSYSAVVNDFVTTDSTGGTVPITLPTAPVNGSLIWVKQVAGTNTTTITTGGSDVFNISGGLTSITLPGLNSSVQLEYKSGIWYSQAVSNALSFYDLRYSPLAGSSSITTLGTITSGIWNGNLITGTYGGTGVNNGSNTITLAGNLITTGAFNTTFAASATATFTLPGVSQTLASLAGTETLTNKTIAGGSNTISGIANASLTNSSITINGTSISLGGTKTLTLASADYANQGTTITILHGNASGNPSFSQIVIADLSATGTPSSTTFLRGDNTWSTPAGGGTVTSIATSAGVTGGTITSTGTLSLDLTYAPTWTGIHTFQNNSLSTTTADEILIFNTTAATVGAQKVSPGLNIGSNGWGTTGASSQSVNWRFWSQPVQSTVPTGTLNLDFSVAGGAYTNKLNLTSAGNLILTGTTTTTQVIGGLTTNSNTTQANFSSTIGTAAASAQTTASILFGGATTVQIRNQMSGNTSTVLTTGNSYANLVLGSGGVNTTTSGTNAALTNLALMAPAFVLGVGSTTTRTATLLIDGQPTISGTGTLTNTPLALWIRGGSNLISGNATSVGSTWANNTIANVLGSQISFAAATYTDGVTAASTTLTYAGATVHQIPTFASTNVSEVITNAATVFIAGAAAAGTNTTITNPYALYIAAGNSLFNGNITLGTSGNRLFITTGANSPVGDATLVAGTLAITITGLTSSSRAQITRTVSSNTSLTTEYTAVCTSNTLTITADIAAGTINTADTSTLTYFIYN